MLRELLLALRVGGFAARGDAEVQDFREVGFTRTRRENDVLGFEIAVDDALHVRFVERAAHLAHDLDDAIGGDRSLLGDDVGERLSRDELHRNVEGAVVRRAEVEDLDRIRVLELRDGAALAVKARDDRGILREVRVQRFDGDLADGRAHLLLADVDLAHAAFAEHAGHAEAAADDLSDERIRSLFVDGKNGSALRAKPRPLDVFVLARLALHWTRALHESTGVGNSP